MPTEVFTIKPLEWEPLFGDSGGGAFARNPLKPTKYYQVHKIGRSWAWRSPDTIDFGCASPEEGKRLAEEHWQSYVKQALVPVEGNHAD